MEALALLQAELSSTQRESAVEDDAIRALTTRLRDYQQANQAKACCGAFGFLTFS